LHQAQACLTSSVVPAPVVLRMRGFGSGQSIAPDLAFDPYFWRISGKI
jgi:hypothetical protein